MERYSKPNYCHRCRNALRSGGAVLAILAPYIIIYNIYIYIYIIIFIIEFSILLNNDVIIIKWRKNAA